MKRKDIIFIRLPMAVAVGLLISCGGGSGGDGGIVGTGLKGTAAMGAPIKNTVVLIKDNLGKREQTSTDANGKFSASVTGLTPPYILKITATGGRDIFSYATAEGVANLTPLSDLVTRNVFKSDNADVEGAFASNSALDKPPSAEKVSAATTSFTKLLALAYQSYAVPGDFDLFRSEFDPIGITFDGLLDNLAVAFSGSAFTVDFIDPSTGLIANAIDQPSLSFDFTQADVQAPSVPANAKATAASNTSVTIAWKSASDNVGVAGYNVYRGGSKVATIAVSVYQDKGLTPSTNYCYSVEAIDGSGNVSKEKSASTCAKTPVINEISPPLTVTGVAAVGSGNKAINVTWKPSVEVNVLGYRVYRKRATVYEKIASVFTPGFVDRSVIAGSQYCYKVEAFNAANNASPLSAEMCSTAESPTNALPPTTVALTPGGNYSDPQSVILACVDNSNSGCTITYFTVDGRAPTITSPIFVDPINITTTTTLKFFSVDNKGNAEAIKTEIFTF